MTISTEQSLLQIYTHIVQQSFFKKNSKRILFVFHVEELSFLFNKISYLPKENCDYLYNFYEYLIIINTLNKLLKYLQRGLQYLTSLKQS